MSTINYTIRYTKGGNYTANNSLDAIVSGGPIDPFNQNNIQVTTNGDGHYIITDDSQQLLLVTNAPLAEQLPLVAAEDGIYVDMSEIETNVTLWSGDAGDVLIGGAGDDSLKGGGGSDILEGGLGENSIHGGGDNDTISYEHFDAPTQYQPGRLSGIILDMEDGRATDFDQAILSDEFSGFTNVRGSAYDDVLKGSNDTNDLFEGGDGADDLQGRDGIDTASYVHSSLGVTADLWFGTASGGDADGDTFAGIENLIGSKHADTLTGHDGANTLNGNGGGDTLSGMDGADRLVVLDTPVSVDGGAGKDVLIAMGGGAVSLTESGFHGIEAVYVRNDTHLDMSAVSTGTKITSQSTTDHGVEIVGGSGSDRIQAGKGGDTIEGGAGGDKIFGGLGDDTFVFRTGFGRDNVYNFTAGTDRFDVSALVSRFDQIEISQMKDGVNALVTFEGSATGNKIILHDVVASSLHADDFGFLVI
ncbi:Bifunctional hemolysin/adenylate cyclase [Methylobacterium bullatum]|uniref:Bifunctional hemolysin/adenylate cyclase n=1 Tax=Methylobacterium bullatum TaxID=570505 RepID=A0A679J671_9HYPH|nr:Bifunctional hemolysin/adenylate cyclase [Methylobacterium bullatum]